MKYRSVKFEELEVGDIFYVSGDIHINYNFPKWCRCRKDSWYSGIEIEADGTRGVGFVMNNNEIVDVEE